MLIRPFRLGDYSAITRIWQETGLEEQEAESLNDLAKQLAWDSDLVMVAEKEGEVVGVVVGTIDGTRAYFYRLAVLPRLQGAGIRPETGGGDREALQTAWGQSRPDYGESRQS